MDECPMGNKLMNLPFGRLAYLLRSVLAAVAILIALAICISFIFLPAGGVKTGYTPLYSAVPPGKHPPVMIFGVNPLSHPQQLDERYGPIIEFLNRCIPEVKFKLDVSRSFVEFEDKLYSRRIHFALPNPYQAITCIKQGYRIFGKRSHDDEFYGVVLVRKDSGIEQVPDLKGKSISLPAPTALAAGMMPLYYLHTHGLDVNADIKRIFTGSQESSIMSVYQRKSAAGATWSQPWKAFVKQNPRITDELTVKWTTPPLINNALVVRDDVPEDIVRKTAARLFLLQTEEEGRKLLADSFEPGFEAASNETYAPVYDFLEKYNAAVH